MRYGMFDLSGFPLLYTIWRAQRSCIIIFERANILKGCYAGTQFRSC